MPLLLQLSYPILMIFWLGISLRLNDWADSRSSHYSTALEIDNKIPFIPAFASVYFSAYILGNMAYILLFMDPELFRVVVGHLILLIVAILCYVLFPCRVNRRENLSVTNVSTYLISKFQHTSKPYNSFPSMHCAYCFFTAFVIFHYVGFAVGVIMLVWASLVALSTLLTKQHHLIDVFAGAGLASLVYWIIQLV